MERLTAKDFAPELLELYDFYVHGKLSRREFLDRAAAFTLCSMTAVAVLDEIRAGVPSHVSASLMDRPRVTNEEIRERMSGNICRCGAYSNIAEAMAEVAGGRA